MWYNEDNFTVKLGSNFYINTPRLIVYKGEDLFTITRAENTGVLGIDFVIYDSKGQKVANVKQGRIYAKDLDVYERIENQDEYKLIEKATGRIICWIKKKRLADNAELEVNVNLYTRDGFLIEATPEYTNIGSIIFHGSTIRNCGAGIVIG